MGLSDRQMFRVMLISAFLSAAAFMHDGGNNNDLDDNNLGYGTFEDLIGISEDIKDIRNEP